MIPFHSSSAQGRHAINPDGSYSVYCFQCKDYIGTSFTRIQRSLCALCEKALSGEPVTEEFIRAYKLSKQSRVDVSMINVTDELPKHQSVPRKKFSLRTMGGNILSALGTFALNQLEKLPEAAPDMDKKTSVQIAKQKRRGRLFENVDLSAQDSGGIGSMEEVDKSLNRNKGK